MILTRLMRLKGQLILLFFVTVFSTVVSASTITAVQSGNWDQTDTWGGLPAPDGDPCYDTIIIPAGITVTVNAQYDLSGCPSTFIYVAGTLAFSPGSRLHLSDGSAVFVQPGGSVQNSGGGGSASLITIDGTTYWSTSCVPPANPPPNCGTITGPAVICQNCALPIELINFSVNLSAGIAYINWQTASEQENDYFLVQRSVDGFNWETIEQIDGAGNSSSLISYSTEDRSPYLGLSYYRLKQVDINGAFSLSETRVVSNGQFYSDQQLLVMSDQGTTNHNVVIYFSEEVEGDVFIQIVGISGAILYNSAMTVDGGNWVVVYLDKPISSGIYVVSANKMIERAFFQ